MNLAMGLLGSSYRFSHAPLLRTNRGTITILAQSDTKEFSTVSGVRRVEDLGSLARAAVAVSDQLWVDVV